jgi:hypothetical protein
MSQPLGYGFPDRRVARIEPQRTNPASRSAFGVSPGSSNSVCSLTALTSLMVLCTKKADTRPRPRAICYLFGP